MLIELNLIERERERAELEVIINKINVDPV